ncbi:hypothetical protein [Legionella sp. WA2022007384]
MELVIIIDLVRDILSNIIEVTLVFLLIAYFILKYKKNRSEHTFTLRKWKLIKTGVILLLLLFVINLSIALLGRIGSFSYRNTLMGNLLVTEIHPNSSQDITILFNFSPEDPISYWMGFEQMHSPLYKFLYWQYLSIKYSKITQAILSEETQLNLFVSCEAGDKNKFLRYLKDHKIIPGNTISTTVEFCFGFCLGNKFEIHYADLFIHCKS